MNKGTLFAGAFLLFCVALLSLALDDTVHDFATFGTGAMVLMTIGLAQG